MLRRFLAVMLVPLAIVLATVRHWLRQPQASRRRNLSPAAQLTAVANRTAHALVSDPDRVVDARLPDVRTNT